ncbi:autophagy-related protein 13 homolog [Parasteatoda tepidariorum]|uniref:autophagy-related protein 13 homolog n=1 Tax=Parasteatoda tepidariorum TaxID=114398 RepID=UPI00077FE41A|nr:autophagy-related protein 13 [Parasteatoda tepidariorum]
MSAKSLERLSVREREKLEKYIKSFIAKVPQAIVQSRFGKMRDRSSNCSSLDNDVYEIAIEDDLEVQEKVKEACRNVNPLHEFSVNVEILLHTIDQETLALEEWNIRQVYSQTFWDPRYKVSAEIEVIFRKLYMLLKSVIPVTRANPAFKMSLQHKKYNYVMMYRIYSGEPRISQLGINPVKYKLGEVHTPVGTMSVSVAYRSDQEMTIEPKNSEKENSFMLNSDYFNLDLSPKRLSSAPRTIKNHVLRNNSNSQNVGAFAQCNLVPDPGFPELAFLQKSILHPSRSCLRQENEEANDNVKGDLNSNVSPDVKLDRKDIIKDADRLSCSDVSDGSDFVLVDLKPPFATCDPDHGLGAFYQECQLAPPLSSFSDQPSLEEQVLDVATQLEKFEISMMDFDKFVDSVCQINSKN